MPLIRDYTEPLGGRILLWKMADDDDFTMNDSGVQANLLLNIRHPLRRKQRMAVCSLLNMLHPDAAEGLWYDDLGKPHLKDPGGHISISHSREYAGIYHHPLCRAGIDIEVSHPRIAHVASRFIHPQKETWALENESGMLKVWAAKEAAFKAIGGGGIQFREDLIVGSPLPDGSGELIYNGHLGKLNFSVRYEQLDEAMIVYAIAE
jgi:4'-phosphopantetheinyl transferase